MDERTMLLVAMALLSGDDDDRSRAMSALKKEWDVSERDGGVKVAVSKPSGSLSDMVKAWNEMCDQTGLAKVSRVGTNTARGKMAQARIREYGLEKVIEAIQIIPNCSFLLGKTQKPWTGFTFDWFVRPDNFPKVLEGRYLDKDKPKRVQKPTASDVVEMSDEEWHEMMRRLDEEEG